MFVVDKRDNKVYQVYDIAYNRTGYPLFLIYKDSQWLRVSAKYFRPHRQGYFFDWEDLK